jgi:hypothetical protein
MARPPERTPREVAATPDAGYATLLAKKVFAQQKKVK